MVISHSGGAPLNGFFRYLKDEYRGLVRIWLPLIALNALMPPLVLAMPLVEKQLIDRVMLAQRLDLLPGFALLYGGLWLITMAAQTVRGVVGSYLVQRIAARLRQRLFLHSEALSLAFSRREHSGRTMSLFMNDVPSMAGLLSGTVLNGFTTILGLALGVAVMFSLNWQLAVVAGILPPLVAAAASRITRPIRPAARRAQEKAAELTERLQENLAGIREVVAFGQEHAQGLRFGQTLNELLGLRMRVTLMDTALQSGQSLFSMAVSLVILGFGGYLVITGQTTLGTLVAMRTLFGLVFQPTGQLVSLMSDLQKALGAADRVYAFLDQALPVEERPAAREPQRAGGVIAFEHVSFAYEPKRFVLKQIDLQTRPGEVIALVGPSGAGKSTLMSLVSRFYDPSEGRILLDGVDLRDLTLRGLRRQIGIVFQDSFLFATSVRENIAFGLVGAAESQIIAAAQAANAWEFIERFPKGLDTAVGQRGVQLSEGQKQRLTIARALLRDPRILILDEPTSALDARSEHLLQKALENLFRGRTTFVIAHRLATVRRADRILVLEEGCIVEQGTHSELMRREGLYREFFALQFGSAPAAAGEAPPSPAPTPAFAPA